jgi:hypothetical protein
VLSLFSSRLNWDSPPHQIACRRGGGESQFGGSLGIYVLCGTASLENLPNNLPLSSRLRENTLRYQIFDPGGHMIRSVHMNCCLTAQIRFMHFKGPGSFNFCFKSAKILTN